MEGNEMEIEIKKSVTLIEEGSVMLNDLYSNLVLVLGPTSSEKTNLLKILSASDEHLTCLDVGASRTFDDESSTLLVLQDSHKTAYLDGPEFSDSPAFNDISKTYLRKRITESATSVKLVLTVRYFWLKEGKRFLEFIRSSANFLEDVSDYNNSIGLVVTEVPTEYVVDGMTAIISDDEIRQHIADLILRMEKTESDFRIGQFLKILLHQKFDAYNRIAVIRNPDTIGTVWRSWFSKSCKVDLQQMLVELEYNSNPNLIYLLSDKTKTMLSAWLANEGHSNISSPSGFLPSEMKLSQVLTRIKYLKFIQTVIEVDDDKLKADLENTVNVFDDRLSALQKSTEWMRFLGSFTAKISSYELQRKKHKILANLTKIDNKNFNEFLTRVDDFMDVSKVRKTNLTEDKLWILNAVLRTLLEKPVLSYKNKHLSVKGNFILLSEIARQIDEHIDKNMDHIEIFASDTIFIDEDISTQGKNLRFAVAAPTWHVVGSKVFKLDGSPGPGLGKAVSGTFPGGEGQPGKPGLPGKPGGSFLGIGTEFIHGENLKISVNGGQGGSGQDGGNGAEGTNGLKPLLYINGTPEDHLRPYKHELISSKSMSTIKSVFSPVRKHELYRVYGTPGGKGGNGGIGGKGGFGGEAGEINIIDLGKTSWIVKSLAKGIDGLDGRSGRGGQGGLAGENIIVQHRIVDPDYNMKVGLTIGAPMIGLFSLLVSNHKHEWSDGSPEKRQHQNRGPTGMDGDNSTKNQDGIIFPNEVPRFQTFASPIKKFKAFLLDNINFVNWKAIIPTFKSMENDEMLLLQKSRELLAELRALEFETDGKQALSSYLLLQKKVLRCARRELKSFPKSRKLLSYIYAAAQSHVCKLFSVGSGGNFAGTTSDTNMELKSVNLPELLKRRIEQELDDVDFFLNKTKSIIEDREKVLPLRSVDALLSVSKTLSFLSETGKTITSFLSKTSNIDKSLYLNHSPKKFLIPRNLSAYMKQEERLETDFHSVDEFENELQRNIGVIIENLETKSMKDFLALWDVRNWLINVRRRGLDLAKDSYLHGLLEMHIEGFGEVMTTLSDTFDRIRHYQRIKELADYMSDLSASESLSADVGENSLKITFNFLECVIQTNIVRSTYLAVLSGVQKEQFPFARYLESQLQMQESRSKHLCQTGLERKRDFWTLGLTEMLNLAFLASQKASSAQGQGRLVEVVFTWNSEEHKSIISDLLSGKEVMLKADFSKGVAKSGVRFSHVHFMLDTLEPGLSSELEALDKFDATLTHWGNSYFKCDSNFYSITNKAVTFTWNGRMQLDEGRSPYAMWSLQLHAPNASFSEVASLGNKLQLDLIASGWYLNDLSVCKKDLRQFYQEEDISFKPVSSSGSKTYSSINFLIGFAVQKLVDSFSQFFQIPKLQFERPSIFYPRDFVGNYESEVQQIANNGIILAPVLLHLWRKYLKKPVAEKKVEWISLTVERRSLWEQFLNVSHGILELLQEHSRARSEVQQFREAFEVRKDDIRAMTESLRVDSRAVEELEINLLAFAIDLQDDEHLFKVRNSMKLSAMLNNLYDTVSLLPDYHAKWQRVRMCNPVVPRERTKPVLIPNLSVLERRQEAIHCRQLTSSIELLRFL